MYSSMKVCSSRSTLLEDGERRFGRTFGDLSLLLKDAWIQLINSDGFDSLRCKVLPKGSGSRLFPLPTSLHLDQLGKDSSEEMKATVENLCRALNSDSMAGVEVERPCSPPSRVQSRLVEHLLKQARMACAWSEKVEEVDWQDFFNVKGIDYKGDEVLVAKSTQWENVSPALPSEIGWVNLVDVVSHGLVDYVKGFDDFLILEEDQRCMSTPPK